MANIKLNKTSLPSEVSVGDVLVLRDYRTPARIVVEFDGKYGALNPTTGRAHVIKDTIKEIVTYFDTDIVRVIPTANIMINEVY